MEQRLVQQMATTEMFNSFHCCFFFMKRIFYSGWNSLLIIISRIFKLLLLTSNDEYVEIDGRCDVAGAIEAAIGAGVAVGVKLTVNGLAVVGGKYS